MSGARPSGSRPARFQSSQNPDLEKATHGDWDAFFRALPILRLPRGFDVDRFIEQELEDEARKEGP
jgi:hypothetical protein